MVGGFSTFVGTATYGVALVLLMIIKLWRPRASLSRALSLFWRNFLGTIDMTASMLVRMSLGNNAVTRIQIRYDGDTWVAVA